MLSFLPTNLPYQATVSQTLSKPTWDVILLISLAAIGFFYGLYRGKRRIAATIIYTYITVAIFTVLPLDKIAKLGGGVNEYYLKAGSFLVLFILLSLLLGSKGSRGFNSSGGWWQVFLLSFVQVGFLIHLLFSFLSTEQIKNLAPISRRFFANPNYHIWWMLGPVILVILLRRLERD